MDIRTGKKYKTYEDAKKAGVGDEFLVLTDGPQQDAHRVEPVTKFTFNKGSFKPIPVKK